MKTELVKFLRLKHYLKKYLKKKCDVLLYVGVCVGDSPTKKKNAE